MNAPDNEVRLQNRLAAHLDALLADEAQNADQLAAGAPAEAHQLLRLATQLHAVLKPVEPSAEFVMRLRGEFVDDTPNTLVLRWKKLPPRYQLAAKVGGFTLTAGLTVLAVRRALSVVAGVRARQHEEPDSALSMNTVS